MPRAAQNRFQPFGFVSRNIIWFGLPLLIVIAAFFRFWRLSSLPPGLTGAEALIGIEAQHLLHHGWIPGFTAATGYAPLFVWIQAVGVWLFGNTELALRVWPAALGVLAVVLTWYWARAWFGQRIGWIAAYLLAITPWAVTVSRNATPAAVLPLLVSITLLVGTKAYYEAGIRWRYALLGVTVLNLLSGPIGWLLATLTFAIAITQIARRPKLLSASIPSLALYVAALVVALGALFVVVTSWHSLSHLAVSTGATANLGQVTNNLFRTAIMFNLSGDESFAHNLGSEPLLNAFVGLMFVAGVLVSISRYTKKTYSITLVSFLVLLMPAIATTTGVPNAARAVGALPVVMVLAAIGVSYMLELWYSTFPINSAARATGQGAIILLLALSLFHGFTQYFRAWAGSAETYVAYNEPAVGVSSFVLANGWKGQRYVVVTIDETPVVRYLVADRKPYALITSQDIASIPVAASTRQFVITTRARNDAARSLSVKFPGSILKPHLSGFSQDEIFYVYEIGK